MNLRRRQLVAAAGTALVAGCLGRSNDDAGGADGRTDPAPTGTRSTTATGSGGETDGAGGTGGGFDAFPTASDRLPLPEAPQVLRDEAESGGPPKDGIPSIDDPDFAGPGDVTFLDPGDPVFGVVRDGVAKAYPQNILAQHEIVNDVLAGDPVSVTYCPLTGTVQGFERGETTFGVSGRLINANLVMYDRATEAWWPQILATSIPGPWNEDPPIRSLQEFRLRWTTWDRWRDQYPDTQVLTTNTGYARNYARDPYGGYNPRSGYYESGPPMFSALHDDERHSPKTVVMGARTPEGAVAVPKAAIRDAGLVPGELGDTPILAVYDPRYDTAYVYRNPEGREFQWTAGTVIATDGTEFAPDALPLSRIHTFDAMWFAWAGYYPETAHYA